MTNELSKERAIEALYTVRAYYASLTAGYPKGKDCRGIGDVMCSEIANSCLMAIEALEQEPCEDCISREAVRRILANQRDELVKLHTVNPKDNPKADAMAYGVNWSLNTLMELPSVTPSYNSIKTELKSCDDYISRTELLARIDAERKHLLDLKMDGAEHIIVHHARRIIEDMPSIERR